MLYGLMGALLNIKKPSYAVGEYATYIITSAQPGAQILWTSYLNNDSQPYEYQVPYGVVGDDGTATITWPDPFFKWSIGSWKKLIELQNPDGTVDQATVNFTVTASGGTAPAPAPTVPARPVTPVVVPPVSRGGTTPPYVPPINPANPPDILTPPRSLYPAGQAPRPSMVDTRDTTTPRSTADLPPLQPGPDILNPAPAPMPGRTPPAAPVTPIYTAPGQQPGGQAPGQGTGQAPSGGFSLTGSVGGVPIWLILIGAVVLLKGK